VQSQNWLTIFFEELKRRRVFRVATLYVIFLWPIIQIVDILSPALDLPNSTMQVLLIFFVIGFPVALIMGWLFNLNASGVVLTVSSDTSQPAEEQAFIRRNTERVIIVILLVLVVVLFGVQMNSKSGNPLLTALIGQPPAPTQTADANAPKSIAVLPFASFSEEDQDRYFADGLTEELLNVLSRIQRLRVAARTSSFAYRDVQKTVQEIGKELNVDTILEGSVRRNDINATVRVTAQLIDVNTGSHLWSQTFDRQLQDIFKVQDEIASSVVSHLKVTLLSDEDHVIKSRASANPQAMVAHSMGKTELAKRTQVALVDAARFFQKAIEYDPNYASAYRGLADANTLLFSYTKKSDPQLITDAQAAVDKALQLDPLSGKSWASQGLIYMQDMKTRDKALSSLEKAMEYNPSYGMAYMWYGNLMEDKDTQDQYHRKAFELDPRSPVAAYNVANDLILAGREVEAMEIFDQIIESDPYYPGAYRLVAQINRYRGRLDEAILQFKEVYGLEETPETAMEIARLYFELGDFDHANQWSSRAKDGLEGENSQQLEWMHIGMAIAQGQPEQSNKLLRKQLDLSSGGLDYSFDATYAAYLLGDYELVVAMYEKANVIEPEDQMRNKPMRIDASIGAAFAYKYLGFTDKSNHLLEAIDADLDKIINSGRRFEPVNWYRKAELLAIQGNPQMSIVYLQRAVDEGWRQHWRPAVDPALVSILENENFKSMMAGLTARMNLMREQLAFEESFDEEWQG
jgi:TolB-like protein